MPVPLVIRSVLSGCLLALACGACAERDDGLRRGRVEIERTTTTTNLPCDVPATAERALTEATFGAERLDEAGRAEVRRRLDELTASLPADLHEDVATLSAAFDAAWVPAGPDGDDPFDTPEYLAADQAIRRYVDGGCTGT